MELEEQRPEGWRPSDVPWPPKNLPGLESGGSLERGLLDDLWGLEQRRAQSASNGQAHPAPAGQMANAPSLPQSWPSDHLSTSDGASEGQDHDIESSTGPVGHLSEELLGNVPLLGRKSRKTTWLWPGYLAAGKVTIFDGDPGVGKSTLSLFIASRLSTSSPLLDGFRPEKATTLILNADDDIDDTSLARLEADEADLSRLSMQASVPTEDGRLRHSQLPGDIEYLKKVVQTRGAGLMIVDPLMAFLNVKDSNNDQQIRQALYPLTDFAAETTALCWWCDI